MTKISFYSFKKGDQVPEWLYRVKDKSSSTNALCTFGSSGGVGIGNDGSIVIWPSEERSPEEVIFEVAGFFGNAIAGHPGGDKLLKVLTSIEDAVSLLGESVLDESENISAATPA